MRLHLIGIFHTQSRAEYSHCAFTGKALRFPKMMQQQGYEVIEYSNAGSQAGASEHVEMLSDAEFERLYGARECTAFYGDDATVGSEGHALFEQRLIPALRERLEPQDIICHPFGHAHQRLMEEFPSHQHVETGIGYPTLMPNSYRIFESYAWMHYHHVNESLHVSSPDSSENSHLGLVFGKKKNVIFVHYRFCNRESPVKILLRGNHLASFRLCRLPLPSLLCAEVWKGRDGNHGFHGFRL